MKLTPSAIKAGEKKLKARIARDLASGAMRIPTSTEMRQIEADTAREQKRDELRPTRGRPKSGTKSAGVVGRSVKATPGFWERFDEAAELRGLTTHAAMREAVEGWLQAAYTDEEGASHDRPVRRRSS